MLLYESMPHADFLAPHKHTTAPSTVSKITIKPKKILPNAPVTREALAMPSIEPALDETQDFQVHSAYPTEEVEENDAAAAAAAQPQTEVEMDDLEAESSYVPVPADSENSGSSNSHHRVPTGVCLFCSQIAAD